MCGACEGPDGDACEEPDEVPGGGGSGEAAAAYVCGILLGERVRKTEGEFALQRTVLLEAQYLVDFLFHITGRSCDPERYRAIQTD